MSASSLPVRTARAPIAEDMLVDCLARAEAANGGELITLFEITTAAAFLAFAETPADLLLLETGLGGRLDATNVVAKPLLTAITPISIDHVSFLGDTLAADRRREGRHPQARRSVHGGRQEQEAFAVIERRAEEIGAPLHVSGRDFDMFEQHGRLIFQTASRLIDLPLPRLNGRHQIDNAGAAIAAASLAVRGRADHAGARAGADPCRMAGAARAPRRRRALCLCRRGHRDLARRRAQRRRRPGHRARAGRTRRARAARRPSHLGHDGDEGRARLHRPVQGPGRAHLYGADPRRAERLLGRGAGRDRRQPKASRSRPRAACRTRSSVAGGAAGIPGAC